MIRGIYGEDKIYVDLVARSIKKCNRYQKQWHQSLYFPTGALWFFQIDDTYAKKSLPIVNEAGLKSEELSRSEVKKRYPQVNLSGIKSFYYEHEAGYLPARHCCQVGLENFVKKGVVSQQTVSMYQVDVEYRTEECLEKVFDVPGYDNECDWYHRAFVTMLNVYDEDGESRELFRGLNHVFVVKSLDQITSFWTILVKD